MKQFENHDIRFTSNQFIYGLPAKSFNKRQAWGVKLAASYNASGMIL